MHSAVLTFVFLSVGQPKTEVNPGVTYTFDFAEKTHGLKLKSGTFKEGLFYQGRSRATNGHILLLEFTRDLTAKELENTKKAFRSIDGKDQPQKTDVVVHFFDTDNVSAAALPIQRVDGQITGRKGDAFRILVGDPHLRDKLRKVEGRQRDPEATFETGEAKAVESK